MDKKPASWIKMTLSSIYSTVALPKYMKTYEKTQPSIQIKDVHESGLSAGTRRYSQVTPVLTGIHKYLQVPALKYLRIPVSVRVTGSPLRSTGFVKTSNSLIKRIPEHLTSWIINCVPEANHDKTNCPNINTVVDLLYKRIGKNTFNCNPYSKLLDKGNTSKHVQSDNNKSIWTSDDKLKDQGRRQPQYTQDLKSTKDNIELIANQLRDLQLSVVHVKIQEHRTETRRSMLKIFSRVLKHT
ncbi:hypothetical protein BDP27DRAFT_1367887 [Rhodocollybia butyracea]|uniref:Uncharacterized protein n=1 Tax=Rhodocollybia butyracea TaxID=206335 RepID=A0A9P5PHZ7_9AGAR|nr:hypothetical protein BDP27DRAFT_1367887 [Rhodocollybia butyracea]